MTQLGLSISATVQVWLGYQQSLRSCQTGLMLNMDVAATAFIEAMDAIPFLANAARASDVQRMNAMQLKKASHAVRGVQASGQAPFTYIVDCPSLGSELSTRSLSAASKPLLRRASAPTT